MFSSDKFIVITILIQ